MVPVEVVLSPQLMVALNALAGSIPLAWVKVATVILLLFFEVTVFGDPDTMIAGSFTAVLAVTLLLLELLSAEVAVTEATLVSDPSSVAWAVTVSVTVVPLAM